MRDTEFIILDIETTGFSKVNDKIIEIAAIKVNLATGKIISQFSNLIKISTSVPAYIYELTRITDAMLRRSGINLKTSLNDLALFCGQSKIYAHYAAFDKGFIRRNLENEKVVYQETEWVDTINIFKAKIPGLRSYKLEHLMNKFNIGKHTHRALDDVKNTFTLLKHAHGIK